MKIGLPRNKSWESRIAVTFVAIFDEGVHTACAVSILKV